MVLRSLFILILVSGLVWLRAHNEGKPTPKLEVPEFTAVGGKLSQKMIDFCTENPKNCQEILKKINNSTGNP